ncbi:MAG: M12 family metallopeptidase [Oligoflexia bacterium]|nr:M12 family metallopeptidase [Oligoflexia bacterium]
MKKCEFNIMKIITMVSLLIFILLTILLLIARFNQIDVHQNPLQSESAPQANRHFENNGSSAVDGMSAATPLAASMSVSMPDINPSVLKAPKQLQRHHQKKEQSREMPPPPGAVSAELVEGFLITQSDIILGRPDDEATLDENRHFYVKPKFGSIWPTSKIPYIIDPGVVDSERILNAIAYLKEHTPIRLLPRKNEENVLVFMPSQELCASMLGMVGGIQPIYLKEECSTQNILHEIMHALGFIHEQSRPDRDSFVEVVWENIEEGKGMQFEITPSEIAHIYKKNAFVFDYASIMLYDAAAFAKEYGLKTLVSRTKLPLAPTQEGLSADDLQRINTIYGPPTTKINSKESQFKK